MITRHFRSVSCFVLAIGAFAVADAQGAPRGFQISPAQEDLINPGMSMNDVQLALGRPATNMKFRNQAGPTFTYRVVGNDDVLFDVQFADDGKVASAGERVNPNGGAGGGHGRR